MTERQQDPQRRRQNAQEETEQDSAAESRAQEASEELEAFLRAGDEIIERHLADHSSQDFVESMRQRGGQ
jgi:hypothetical protein